MQPVVLKTEGEQEASLVERLRERETPAHDYVQLPSLFQALRYHQDATVYDEEFLHRVHAPVVRRVPSSLIGSSVMGAYFPGRHEIWMNTDERFAAQYGATLRHEKLHAQNPERHPDRRENELRNRYATYAVTGDHSQLVGFYHTS